MQPRKILISLAIQYDGDWNSIRQAISDKSYLAEPDFIEKRAANLRCGAITILDENYPKQLFNLWKPPFVLFYYGDISLLNSFDNSLAVIGTREPSSEGIEATRSIFNNINKDIVIVSGLAAGIDAEAHRLAIEKGHKTIAILGNGIDFCYPSINRSLYYKIRREHLVLSEYPPGTPPDRVLFPARNRIIAGLSKCILVTEANLRSGTMITVGLGLTIGRDILCVPSSNLGQSGTNLCIKDGAYLVETSEDINAFYRP